MLLMFTSFTATGMEERNLFSIAVSLNFKLCSSHFCCHKKFFKQDFVLFFFQKCKQMKQVVKRMVDESNVQATPQVID